MGEVIHITFRQPDVSDYRYLAKLPPNRIAKIIANMSKEEREQYRANLSKSSNANWTKLVNGHGLVNGTARLLETITRPCNKNKPINMMILGCLELIMNEMHKDTQYELEEFHDAIGLVVEHLKQQQEFKLTDL